MPGYLGSSPSDLSEDPTLIRPEDDSKPKVHTGYWPTFDPEHERDQLSDTEDGVLLLVKNRDCKPWFAPSILSAYTKIISISSQASTCRGLVFTLPRASRSSTRLRVRTNVD